MNEVGQIRQDCHICGTPLEYLEQGIPVRCTVCGREERGNVLCPEGHYVCEACHSPDFLTSLRTFLRESSETSPFLLAEELMDHHALPMLGCFGEPPARRLAPTVASPEYVGWSRPWEHATASSWEPDAGWDHRPWPPWSSLGSWDW